MPYDESRFQNGGPQDSPSENHLARFIVEIVSPLGLSTFREPCAGRGSKPYDPSVLLSLLFYGYAARAFSSCKIEAATYDSIAFRAAGDRPGKQGYRRAKQILKV